GVISVHVSQSLRTAIGVQGSTTGDFTNRGLLEVSSQTGQAAAGAFGGTGFDFVNSGMIRVTAATEARGVFMTGVSFTNSGTIDIHGHGFEYGVSGSDATGAFVNTGTIRVDNTG